MFGTKWDNCPTCAVYNPSGSYKITQFSPTKIKFWRVLNKYKYFRLDEFKFCEFYFVQVYCKLPSSFKFKIYWIRLGFVQLLNYIDVTLQNDIIIKPVGHWNGNNYVQMCKKIKHPQSTYSLSESIYEMLEPCQLICPPGRLLKVKISVVIRGKDCTFGTKVYVNCA